MTTRWLVLLSTAFARGYDKVRQEPIAKAVHGIAAQCSTAEAHMNCTNYSVESLSSCGPDDLTCQCTQVRAIKDYCDDVCGSPAHPHQATTLFLETSCSQVKRSADFSSVLGSELTMHQLFDLQGRPRVALKAMEDQLRQATESVRHGMQSVDGVDESSVSDPVSDPEVEDLEKRDYVVYHVDSNTPAERERLKDKAAQAAMILQAEFDVKASTLVEEVPTDDESEPEAKNERTKPEQREGHAYIFNVAHATVAAYPSSSKQLQPSAPVTQQDGRLNRAKQYLRAKINHVVTNSSVEDGANTSSNNYTRGTTTINPENNSPSAPSFDTSGGSAKTLALPFVVAAMVALAL